MDQYNIQSELLSILTVNTIYVAQIIINETQSHQVVSMLLLCVGVTFDGVYRFIRPARLKPAGSFKGKQKKKLSIEHVFKN